MRLISTRRVTCLFVTSVTYHNQLSKQLQPQSEFPVKKFKVQEVAAVRVHLERSNLISHCGDSDKWMMFHVRRSNVFERVRKGSGKAERGTGLSVQFSQYLEPWTGPRSGLGKVRFEPRFKTELFHHYSIASIAVKLSTR